MIGHPQKTAYAVVLAAVGLLLAAPARADVVTFDALSDDCGVIETPPVMSEGFSFDPDGAGPGGGLTICPTVGSESDNASNATTYLGGLVSGIEMMKTGGLPFELVSFDAARLFTATSQLVGFNATSLDLSGDLDGGGTVGGSISLSVVPDGPNPPGTVIDFTTFTMVGGLSSFAGASLVKLTFTPDEPFSGFPGSFGIDDITLAMEQQQAIPEPATAGLLLLAGLAVVPWRRRRLTC